MNNLSSRPFHSLSTLLLVWGLMWIAWPSTVIAQANGPVSEDEAAVLDEAGPVPADTEAPETNEQKPSIPRNPQEILEALGWPFVSPFLAASFISLWF